jgi:VWFA-related protein
MSLSRAMLRMLFLVSIVGGTLPASSPPQSQASAPPVTAPAPPAQQEPAPTSQPPQPAPVQSNSQQGKQQPGYTINVQSTTVRLDVVVTDQDGDIITGLTKENFRVFQDNAPQQVTNFTPSDAPITMVMLMEFSNHFGAYISYQGMQWAFPFLSELKKQDWVALITYDLKPHIEVDFTQDKDEIADGLRHQMIPAFSEANMFDALIDTLNRLQDVQGKKSVLLITSGFDTFSKHTLDQTYKRVKQTDVTIFCVGMGEDFIEYLQEHHMLSTNTRLDYYQAKNELTYFSSMTGGYAWFPQFYGQMPDIFHSVAEFLRNQYSLGVVPSGDINDGKYHKLRVDVVDKDGQPLMVSDKKGKKRKVIVYARQGYMALAPGVGD